jgi:hypothetical protein
MKKERKPSKSIIPNFQTTVRTMTNKTGTLLKQEAIGIMANLFQLISLIKLKNWLGARWMG